MFCSKQSHHQEECRKRINTNQPCLDSILGFLAQNQYHQQQKWCSDPGSPGPGCSILSLMEPLHQAPAIIPQLIMSLWAVSIMTYNKLSEIMMPLNGGNKIRPRINVSTRTKTFNWLIDTGAAITCKNAYSFREAFGHSRPKLLKKSAGCITANGAWMSSLGIFEIEMTRHKIYAPSDSGQR